MEEIFSYGRAGFKKFLRDNLQAILYTIILHLVVLIVLVFVKVEGLKQDAELGVRVEFEERTVEDILDEQEMEVTEDWLKQILASREAASNRAVNLNADEEFSQEISTEDYVSDLLKQIEEARNEQDRERLEELQAILASADFVPPQEESASDDRGEYTGPTTITFEFMEAPKERGKVRLTVPVYRCLGSGRVQVEVLVAPDGHVLSAELYGPIEGTDKVCFAEAALEAAKASRFRIDLNAPGKHRAHITYAFVAQ